MNKFRFTLMALAIMAFTLMISSSAQAQATRTWVSGVGDDANPCSRTAPCKTWAGAISKTAAGGEIDALDPGGFGAVTITKSITINGGGSLASSLVAGATHGIIVNAGPSDVVILRNLEVYGVSGALNGILYVGGLELHVEQVKITGFSGQAILYLPAVQNSLFVSHSHLRNNAGGGVYAVPGASGIGKMALNHVVMEGNGRGVRAEDGTTVHIENCTITGNDFNGITAVGSSRATDINIHNTTASHNGAVGISSQGAQSTVRISNVMATRNGSLGLESTGGGGIVSSKNNTVQGNLGGDGAPTASPGQI